MVAQTNFRHIMLTPNEIRDEQQTEDAIRELRQQIVDGEDFASLAQTEFRRRHLRRRRRRYGLDQRGATASGHGGRN